MIRCCIFDLDGTLFYTLTTITYYLNDTLRKYGIAEINEEQCRLFIGNGARALVRRSLAAGGVTDSDIEERVLSEYNAKYDKDTLYLTRPYDGIPELISALKDNGISLAVLSNKPDDTTRDIVERMFPGAFNIARGGRDDIPLKPAPDGLIRLMSDLSVSCDEVMYIGDTGVDIATGKAASVRSTVGVSWGYREREELCRLGADLVVDSPADIIKEALKID